MRKFASVLAAAGLSVGVLLSAASAHAALIVNTFTAPPGPYNLGNPLGTIAAIKILKSNSYAWTFTTTGAFDVLLQLQASSFGPLTPQPLAFSLFSGTPGSGSLLSTSLFQTGPAIDLVLGAGNYYVQLDPANIVKREELASGALTITAIPEPAEWALMTLGVGLLGLAARRRRALAAA